jgi:hypothetical protein
MFLNPKNQVRYCIELFLYLQVLDFLTTLVGFKYGLVELSPFGRELNRLDQMFGVFLAKLIAVLLGAICLWIKRPHVIRWINYWYAALVVWNLCLILDRGLPPPG